MSKFSNCGASPLIRSLFFFCFFLSLFFFIICRSDFPRFARLIRLLYLKWLAQYKMAYMSEGHDIHLRHNGLRLNDLRLTKPMIMCN